MSTATLGAGCFWCIEPLFNLLKGVESVMPGYSGGFSKNPTFESIHGTGSVDHAEVVQVTFDESVLPYKELLKIFYAVHDPTTLNRQGYDVGPEYRSIILYHSQEQKLAAEDITNTFAAQMWSDKVVTEIKLFEVFYPAEDYHHNFFENNPNAAYCQIIINPKLQKFRQTFADKFKG